MANVEAYENGFSVYQISNNGNYSHLNMFKHLKLGQQMDRGDYSTEHRQERINALQAPKSVNALANILGDQEDVKYPIYRDITLATLILDGYNNILRIWIDANPRDNEPEIILNLEDNSLQSSSELVSARLPALPNVVEQRGKGRQN